jgi:hypothetical protein
MLLHGWNRIGSFTAGLGKILVVERMVIIDIYLYLLMAGTALVVSLIAYNLFNYLQKSLNPFQRKLRSIANRTGKRKSEKKEISRDDVILLGGCLGGMLFALMIAWGTSQVMLACIIGAGTGTGIVKFFQKNSEHTKRMKKLREIAILSETIDFLTQVGYSIPQALKYGAPIDRVITYTYCISSVP